MPNLLSDLMPWEVAEIRWSAREAFLAFFWDSQEEFNLTMRCQASEALVNPKVMAAMNAVRRGKDREAILFLRDAIQSLEEFSSSILPDHFIVEARDQYLGECETDRKWNGTNG